ncbi:MAG: hypothetical protein U0587_20965 [Candidatus Binatia bacterium]
MKARALARDIPVYQHRTLKGTGVQHKFSELGADLAVLAFVTQIVARPIFETPRPGSICFTRHCCRVTAAIRAKVYNLNTWLRPPAWGVYDVAVRGATGLRYIDRQ